MQKRIFAVGVFFLTISEKRWIMIVVIVMYAVIPRKGLTVLSSSKSIERYRTHQSTNRYTHAGGHPKGSCRTRIDRKGYDKLKTYAAGRDIPARDWQDYLLQMLNLGYFEIAYNENNHLKITESGHKVLFGKEPAMLVVIKREEFTPKERRRKRLKNRKSSSLRQQPSVKKIRIYLKNFVY